jgi:hypothetical protein
MHLQQHYFANSFVKVLNGLSGNCQQQYGFPLKAAMICLPKQIHFSIDSNLFHVCLCFFSSQNQQSQPLTAQDCTVSSPMKLNATFSGTVGTEKPQDTSALPD